MADFAKGNRVTRETDIVSELQKVLDRFQYENEDGFELIVIPDEDESKVDTILTARGFRKQ